MPTATSGTHLSETHRSSRAAWLRAAVLGANDGIVSTACLMLGVAATDAGRQAILVAGLAGLVAGALSMAAGEYVSVSSQRDVELADEATEREELEQFPEAELRELTEIYVRRGLDRALARQVAQQLHAHDALGAHLRDELHLTPGEFANPVQASVTSAASFAVGAALPLIAGLFGSGTVRLVLIAAVSLVGLAVLGAAGARAGGAVTGRAAARVLAGGILAMAISLAIGRAVGTAV